MLLRRLALAGAFALALAGQALAVTPAQRGGVINLPPPPPAAGGCPTATTVLARLGGGENVSAYTTMICAMVADGTWAKLDTFYLTATDTSSDALINLKSSSFSPATVSNAPTFTANVGYTGNGSNTTLNTTYNFSTSGGNYAQNAANIWAWTIQTATGNGCGVGGADGGFESYLQPYNFSSVSAAGVNGTGTIASGTIGNGTGLYQISRTSAVQLDLYKNGSNIATSGANTSTGLDSTTLVGLACASGTVYAGTVAAFGSGGGFTSGDAANFYADLHAALHAINGSQFP